MHSKAPFQPTKGLEKLPTCAVNPATPILLMENEAAPQYSQGSRVWNHQFHLPGPLFQSPIPSRLFPAAAMHPVPLRQS